MNEPSPHCFHPRRNFFSARCIAASVVAAALLAAVGAQADTIAYSNNFDEAGSNIAFPNEVTNAQWTVSGGTYIQNGAVNNVATTASISSSNFTGFNNSDSFTLTTQFSVASSGFIGPTANAAYTLGFGIFATNSGFSSTSPNSYYLADFSFAQNQATQGLLRILSLGDSAGFTTITTGLADDNPGSSVLAINLDTIYTLKSTVTNNSGTLTMSLALFDADGITQIGTAAEVQDTSPLAGEFFGYRNRYSSNGAISADVAFDNFTVAVIPEPGTWALAMSGFVLFAACLRCRRTRS